MEELFKWLPIIIWTIAFIVWIVRLENKVKNIKDGVCEMKENHKKEIKEVKEGYKEEFSDIKSIIKDLASVTQNLSISMAELKVIVTKQISPST